MHPIPIHESTYMHVHVHAWILVICGCLYCYNIIIHVLLLFSLYDMAGQNVGITWKNMTVANNSLVTLSVVPNSVSTLNTANQYPLVCQGIAGGQWYEPNGTLHPLATSDPVPDSTGGYGQRNMSAGIELYRGTPAVFPHGVQCCTNTTITCTLCWSVY